MFGNTMKKYTFMFETPFIFNDFQFHVTDFNDFELQYAFDKVCTYFWQLVWFQKG